MEIALEKMPSPASSVPPRGARCRVKDQASFKREGEHARARSRGHWYSSGGWQRYPFDRSASIDALTRSGGTKARPQGSGRPSHHIGS